MAHGVRCVKYHLSKRIKNPVHGNFELSIEIRGQQLNWHFVVDLEITFLSINLSTMLELIMQKDFDTLFCKVF